MRVKLFILAVYLGVISIIALGHTCVSQTYIP